MYYTRSKSDSTIKTCGHEYVFPFLFHLRAAGKKHQARVAIPVSDFLGSLSFGQCFARLDGLKCKESAHRESSSAVFGFWHLMRSLYLRCRTQRRVTGAIAKGEAEYCSSIAEVPYSLT